MVTDEQTERAHYVPMWKGVPIDSPPASLDAAIEEQAELLTDMRKIDGELGQEYIERDGKRLLKREHADWRRRALTARRLVEGRYRFVKQWIKENGATKRADRHDDVYGIAATAQMRDLTKRIGAIEAIAKAGARLAREHTHENYLELVRVVGDSADVAGV